MRKKKKGELVRRGEGEREREKEVHLCVVGDHLLELFQGLRGVSKLPLLRKHSGGGLEGQILSEQLLNVLFEASTVIQPEMSQITQTQTFIPTPEALEILISWPGDSCSTFFLSSGFMAAKMVSPTCSFPAKATLSKPCDRLTLKELSFGKTTKAKQRTYEG